MIVHEQRPSWIRLILMYRGTALQRTKNRILLTVAVAIGITIAHEKLANVDVPSLTPIPFSLIGLALSIVLGFRNNTSYDRFWEGRKLWGSLVNTTRNLARQILTLVDAAGSTERHRELVYAVAGYTHSLRQHLRDQNLPEELVPFFDAHALDQLGRELNRPIAVLQKLGDRFVEEWRAGRIDTMHLPVLEHSLSSLADIQGGCERIKSTPIPFAYTVLIHRLVGAYCFFLPFGIVSTVGMATPIVVLIVSYAFFGLDEIGDELENPFGLDTHDLPLNQLSRMIEVNLRQRLGETELPPLLVPVDNVLS